jgi:hypothetical protein
LNKIYIIIIYIGDVDAVQLHEQGGGSGPESADLGHQQEVHVERFVHRLPRRNLRLHLHSQIPLPHRQPPLPNPRLKCLLLPPRQQSHPLSRVPRTIPIRPRTGHQ